MTFANRNEQWKHDKDGLEIIKEIPALADKAFKDIDPGDVERLKWAGIYAQRPRDGHFLVRVKLPSGQLTAEQAEVLANLAAEYGKGEIQITIRQAVQIHNITLRDACDILPRLKAVGLSSVEACGDVPRTILGNPLAGVDAEELLDTRPIVEEVFQFFLGNRAFSNLPRKFKISISANPHDAGFARINDIAFVPAKREGEVGFAAYVGGGLSAEPYLAKRLPFFIRPEEVKAVAIAVATLFRDEGYREKRNHCRLKYLVADLGAEAVAAKVEAQTGALLRGGEEVTAPWNYGRFYGVHAQKQAGLSYVGVHVTNGHIAAEDAPQRTVCWEADLTENRTFGAEYSYRETAVYADPLSFTPDAEQPDLYTGEEAPHIVFTPYLRALAAQLTEGITSPAEKAKRIYDYVTLNVRYHFQPSYFVHESIAENCARSRRGDCGIMALTFITLCRIAGIPARWESGFAVAPGDAGCHDWARFYVAPKGWMYADCSYGASMARRGDEVLRRHYFGSLDTGRMVANSAFEAPFDPPMLGFRSDPYDNQSGEMEADGVGLYGDDTVTTKEVLKFEEVE